jgi:uncharacterized cupin superfamily protein
VTETAVPILPSRDLRETLAFYERLGFESRGAEPERWDYLILGRGGIELHVYGDPHVDPLTTAASCYVRVTDADELHRAWDAVGVPRDEATGSRLEPPVDTDYGMREFALVDPSGNLVRVGSPLERPAPVVEEAELEDTGAGLVPSTTGWFVLNARDARWFEKPQQGHSLPLTGVDEHEAETFFPMLGLAVRVMGPGQPSTVYHWETEQEGFLVLAGEGLLLVEGEERPLRQWDFVHCPPGTKHAFVGAGDGPFVLLCASSRQFQKDGPWGLYVADELAARHDASPPETTQDADVAGERFPPSRPTRYRDGLLPAS